MKKNDVQNKWRPHAIIIPFWVGFKIAFFSKFNYFNQNDIAQSAGAVEYTVCFSAKGKTLPLTVLDMTLLWGHILPYPKDGLVQPKHILRASSLGEDNSFLTRHLTNRLQAENV